MPVAPTRTIAQIVRANVFTRFNAVLGAMLALIVLVGGPYQDALFGVVLVANALIGIVQEIRAKRTLDRLTLLVAPRAHALRDGAVVEISIERSSSTTSWTRRPGRDRHDGRMSRPTV